MLNYRLFLTALCLTGVSAAAALPPVNPAPGGPLPPTSAPATSNAIGFTGILTVGAAAIGGESTGTTISDGKTTYELDIRDAILQRKAQELSGRSVTVTGTLTLKPGVEIAQRHILLVDSLQPADIPPTPPPPPAPPAAPRPPLP